MKQMLSYMKLGLVLAAMVAVACTKAPEEEEASVEVEMEYFQEAWEEYFGPDYHVEGSRIWYISKDIISVNTYDWYTDTQWEKIIPYTLDQKEGKYKNVVVLHEQEESETTDRSYYIIKLTDEEMIWQSVESEKNHQHFVNSKFWQTHERFY